MRGRGSSIPSPDPAEARLACAPNFRQLGGQRTADGRTVRRGLIYRSDALLAPRDADAALVAAAGIKLVCDLRSPAERARAPNDWWRTQGVELLAFDLLAPAAGADDPWRILRDDPTPEGAHAMMCRLYAGFPYAAQPAIASLVTRLARGSGPVLIHCTAGKDRTGFLCAILLAALGVEWGDIVADYLASRGRRSAATAAATGELILARTGRSPSDAVLSVMQDVAEPYLAASFATIEHPQAHPLTTGVTEQDLASLRKRLLA